MTLARYITYRFLRSVLLVTLAIAGLTGLLTMVENIRIATRNGAGAAEAGILTLLQLPGILSQAFPLVLMLAALWCFLGLSRSSEMVIVRAAGVSAIRVLTWPVAAAVMLGLMAVGLVNPIVSASTVAAEDYKAGITHSGLNVFSLDEGNMWLRQGTEDGQTVIQADRVTEDGTRLLGVRMHQFDPDNNLVARIEAASAQLGEGVWLLSDVRRWPLDLDPGAPLTGPQQMVQLQVPTNLTQERILESFAQPQNIPFWTLPRFIHDMERAGFSATRHRVFLQSELARPALFAAMVLIGAGFSLRHVRFGQVGIMILFAITAGFALYFFKDVAETLGNNGSIPIMLAAWSAPAAAILLALGLLLHLEDG